MSGLDDSMQCPNLFIFESQKFTGCLLFVHHPRVVVKRWTFVKGATYDQLADYQQQRKDALLDLPYL